MRRVLIAISIVWALVVLFFLWTIFSIAPGEVSISVSALNEAAGTSTTLQVLLLLYFALAAWVVPTTLLWLLTGTPPRALLLASGAIALLGCVGYVAFF